MAINPVPTPTAFPIQFGQRDAKVIETATQAAGVISNKTIDSSNNISASIALSDSSVTANKLAANSVTTSKIADANVTNAKLAGSIAAAKMLTAPSHVIKAIRTGSTSATLVGVASGDVCVKVSGGAVDVSLSVLADTLPWAPLTGDYVFVIRAAS